MFSLKENTNRPISLYTQPSLVGRGELRASLKTPASECFLGICWYNQAAPFVAEQYRAFSLLAILTVVFILQRQPIKMCKNCYPDHRFDKLIEQHTLANFPKFKGTKFVICMRTEKKDLSAFQCQSRALLIFFNIRWVKSIISWKEFIKTNC